MAEVWTSAADAELTSFNQVAADSRGNVYVPDFYQNRVVTFGPDGRVVRTVGRAGSGPGEFRAIRTVQILPGDSLLVFDAGLGRVSVFAPYSDQEAYVITLRDSSPWSIERTRGNDAYLARYEPGFQFGGGAAPQARLDVIRVLNLDGSRRTTLLRFPSRSFIVAQQSISPNPWGHNGMVRLDSRDRVLYAWSDTLGVATYDFSGQRVGAFRHDYTPPPATRADLDYVLSQVPEDMRARFRGALEDSLPARWPAVREVLVDDRDRVWMELAGPLTAQTEWAAFSNDGSYVGSMLVPPGASVYHITGSTVLAKKEDHEGAPRLVKYRMIRPLR